MWVMPMAKDITLYKTDFKNTEYDRHLEIDKSIAQIDKLEKERSLSLEESHSKISYQIKELLKEGDVALLTLGDPGIYATYSYIAQRLRADDIKVVTIPGITSFSAAAAKLGIPLTLADEELHVIPSSYSFEEAFSLKGTLVLMKSGKSYESLVSYIRENKPHCDVYMVENCGMENERLFVGANNLPETSGYFTIIIVRGLK